MLEVFICYFPRNFLRAISVDGDLFGSEMVMMKTWEHFVPFNFLEAGIEILSK